ncbi:MAG TPA: hypothetical protein VNW92_17300 [Polyangiaceae bacterium]|nr:hypothetical protein [Polyangiaceae bacterium]
MTAVSRKPQLDLKATEARLGAWLREHSDEREQDEVPGSKRWQAVASTYSYLFNDIPVAPEELYEGSRKVVKCLEVTARSLTRLEASSAKFLHTARAFLEAETRSLSPDEGWVNVFSVGFSDDELRTLEATSALASQLRNALEEAQKALTRPRPLPMPGDGAGWAGVLRNVLSILRGWGELEWREIADLVVDDYGNELQPRAERYRKLLKHRGGNRTQKSRR